ncbi:hypothetical protein A2U01_0058440, partial [Trifolium medium]|nr:hypothetical protein [Trifolium medium]
MIQQSRANQGGCVFSDLSEDNSNCSPVTAIEGSFAENSFLAKGKLRKFRKPQIPFSSLLGPKCLRLAGIINNSCLVNKQRRSSVSQSVSSESRTQILDSSRSKLVGEGVAESQGDGG